MAADKIKLLCTLKTIALRSNQQPPNLNDTTHLYPYSFIFGSMLLFVPVVLVYFYSSSWLQFYFKGGIGKIYLVCHSNEVVTLFIL